MDDQARTPCGNRGFGRSHAAPGNRERDSGRYHVGRPWSVFAFGQIYSFVRCTRHRHMILDSGLHAGSKTAVLQNPERLHVCHSTCTVVTYRQGLITSGSRIYGVKGCRSPNVASLHGTENGYLRWSANAKHHSIGSKATHKNCEGSHWPTGTAREERQHPECSPSCGSLTSAVEQAIEGITRAKWLVRVPIRSGDVGSRSGVMRAQNSMNCIFSLRPL